jgi:oxaloacetate decarboxylase beta subunit
MNNNAISIIGGADGPTSVFVAAKLNSVPVSLLIVIGIVLLIVAIIFYLKRK